MQRDLCRRPSQDVSPRCKSLGALSPRTRTFSTTTTSSAAVSTPVPCLCLDLDAISSEDSDAKPDDALPASLITVISVSSSDSGLDSSEFHSPAGSLSAPGSPTSSGTLVCVVESPSHYPTPDEPVMLSAASSVLISPNRCREDCVSVTAEVYPVFEVSPDTTVSSFIAYSLVASSCPGAFSSRGSDLLGWLGSHASVAPSAGRNGACAGVSSR